MKRKYSAEFKHSLIEQCQQPDSSVAKIATYSSQVDSIARMMQDIYRKMTG